MQTPLEIRFHNVDASPTVEADIREQVAKLEIQRSDLISCHVTVEAPHRRHRQGNLYSVRVDLRYAGGETVASRSPSEHHAHEDIRLAVHDAFRAVRRQLQDQTRVRRGDVKPHEQAPHGTVAVLDKAAGYGRISTSDGRDIYFHRNSVLNAGFEALELGTEVRFAEELGEQGPQASSVHVIRSHPARD